MPDKYDAAMEYYGLAKLDPLDYKLVKHVVVSHDELKAKYAAVVAELEELQNSIPKLKADAIREAASELVRGVKNYDGSDVDIVNIDELIDYADWLERVKS